MNLDVINILFKMTLFGGILYQMRSFFMQYGYQALKEAHDTDVDLKKKRMTQSFNFVIIFHQKTKTSSTLSKCLRFLKRK
ncbi:hypothetical protein JKY79_01185 [Candidatus Babeliales bacterium]|nr:hypothetical protein [Candidatus Babeliales bacterium]